MIQTHDPSSTHHPIFVDLGLSCSVWIESLWPCAVDAKFGRSACIHHPPFCQAYGPGITAQLITMRVCPQHASGWVGEAYGYPPAR